MIRRPPQSTRPTTLFPSTPPFRSPYGQLLLAKLALFALMLALAAANRWRLTPALAAAAGDDAESVDSDPDEALAAMRSEEHPSDLQSLMRISYAVFCLKTQNNDKRIKNECHNIKPTYSDYID